MLQLIFAIALATRISGVKLGGDRGEDAVVDPRMNAGARAATPERGADDAQTCPAVAQKACGLSDIVPTWRIWLGLWRFELGECTMLDLGQHALGDRATVALATALAFDGHVTVEGRGGALYPAAEVGRCREGGVQQLSLFNNSIGDVGAAALAGVIARNGVLLTLNLRANAIGEKGALALGAALLHNVALTTLDVSENAIGTRGALALAAALTPGAGSSAYNPGTQLRYLSAALNGVAVEGRIALADAVKKSSVLQTVVHTHKLEALQNWNNAALSGEGGGVQG